MNKIVFWQNIISPHQVDLLAALAEKGNHVLLVVEEEVDSFRKTSGWSTHVPDNIDLVISPDNSTIDILISDDSAIHVFTGFFAYRTVSRAFRIACKKKAKIYIYSEYSDWNKWKGKIKLIYKKILMLVYKKYIKGVLATGEKSCEYFKILGLESSKIYEFGYFISPPAKFLELKPRNEGRQIIFVGRLVSCKGIENAIDAFKVAYDIDNRLFFKIIGEGPLREKIEHKVKSLKLEGQIKFLGNISHDLVVSEIRRSSVLVLPNVSKEGWGVVVNESLLSGTPVVVTKYTGSSCLINSPCLGEVIEPGNIDKITDSMLNVQKYSRKRVADLAEKIISPNIVSDYLEEIFFSPDTAGTLPPWRKKIEYFD